MKKMISIVICLSLVAPSFAEARGKEKECPFGMHKVRVDGRRTGVLAGTTVGTGVAVGACALGVIGGFFTFGVTAAMGCGAGALLGAGTGAYVGAEIGDTYDYDCVE